MLFNLSPSNPATNIAEDIRGPESAASVAVTTTASVALPANNARTNYSVYNSGPGTVYIRENETVTTTAYKTPIPPGFLWKEDFNGGSRYLGVVSIIGAAASTVLVAESATV